MSKNHRGKGLLEKYKKGRGTCPICHRTAVKITHEREIDKQKALICKICNSVLAKKEEELKKKESAQATAVKSDTGGTSEA